MAATPTTLFDGSRGYVIDPEPAFEETGGTIDGGRALRDVYSQGDDTEQWDGNSYETVTDGRKTRGWDGQEDARLVREYYDVTADTSAAEASGDVT